MDNAYEDWIDDVIRKFIITPDVHPPKLQRQTLPTDDGRVQQTPTLQPPPPPSRQPEQPQLPK